MKKFYLFVLLCLAAVLSTACHKSSTLSRITLPAIDSLLQDNPDSAYNALADIPVKSIYSRRDRAYYALLLTQARHKNYLPLNDDSLINVAVTYYQGKKDYEKYAKALLYKGICIEESNDPQKAIEIYAQAEQIALQTDDYLTLGLINSQMAWLYQKIYIENQVDIERYKKAIYYFQKAGHKRNEYSAASLLGQQYRVTSQLDSAYHYLELAIELAREMKDSVALFHNYTMLANTYFIDEQYEKARDMSLYVVNNHGEIPIADETYHCLSRAYARMGKADSARLYLDRVSYEAIRSKNHRIMLTLAEALKAEGDFEQALFYTELSHALADSIIDASRRTDLYEIENRYNNQRLENINQRLTYRTRMNSFLIAVISLVAVIIIIIFLVIIDRKHNDINEKIAFIEQLKTETTLYNNTLLEKLDKQNMVETQLKEVLEKRIHTIRELIDLSYRYGGLPDTFIKQFNKTMNINRLSEGALDDLSEVVNAKYNGVVDYLVKKHPDMSEDDVDLVCLLCCGFSATEMSVFYNHSNGKSIYSRKRRLAIKLGLDMSLDEYVTESLHHCQIQSTY
jgi:tetratricopeptide (TPR) repeat protein